MPKPIGSLPDVPFARSSGDRVCQVQFLGRTPYQAAWRLQDRLTSEIAAGRRPPALLLLEHPHTFTLGRQAVPAHLLWGPDECETRRIEVHHVDRGGDITYHGPGQLVAYPLLPLGRVDGSGRLPRADYLGYLRRLEEVIIRTLASYGVHARRMPGLTGVWIPPETATRGRPGKIAAIGVKVDSRGVSRHGLALNVSPDMSYWDGIVPCGLSDYPVLSLAQLLGNPPSVRQTASSLAQHFGEVFQYVTAPIDGLPPEGRIG